ncbi:MFS transporter [Bacillus changyiensis]|uniref:MFS transporter n=1 Tax=Bacillus changyiensis TaxID=3004103 RepID=UPI0022E2DEC5|nr:glycoside-pentoside-hexuronide (GPH):cation symporter [Bacillus changyiensis]MDA1476137.1 glycoside-pentoside-hexuronide (GPH):cation symporter [Bacillus changyiensis]
MGETARKYDMYYEKTQKTTLRKRETASYIGGGFADSLLSGLVNVYLMIYATDVFGISALAVGTIFFVAKIVDGIFDPIAGIIVDKTRTKYGKFRPYLLVSSIVWVILTVLLFNGPDLSDVGKITYMSVIYLLWGFAFTFFDVPYWSFSTVMTQDETKRTRLVSIARVSTLIGMILLMLAGGPIVAKIDSISPGRGYSNLAIMASVLALVFMLVMTFVCKERIKSKGESISLKQTLSYLKMNRPLQLALLTALLFLAMPISQGLSIYFAVNNLGNVGYMAMLNIPPLLIIPFIPVIVPFLTNRFEKKHVFFVSSLASAVTLIILLLVGYENLTVVFILNGLVLFFNLINTTVISLLITDAIDYGEWKTGNRFEAISFAVQAFISKFQGAIAGFLTGLILTAIGYKAGSTTQSATTLDGIYLGFTLVPAVIAVISAIPILFNKFSGRIRQEALEEIKQRRANEEM